MKPTSCSAPADLGGDLGRSALPRGRRTFSTEETLMPERDCGQRSEICRCCGGDCGRNYHLAMGACYCAPCWRLIARSKAQSTPRQQTLPSVERAPILETNH